MSTFLSRLSILLISYIARDHNNKKILLYKLFVRYRVVKLACVKVVLEKNVRRTCDEITISSVSISLAI